MDPEHPAQIHRHLEKQHELLMDSYKLMSNELHKLQVEEEMMMRKFYELMCAQRHQNNKETDNASDNCEDGNAGALVVTTDKEHTA